MAVTGVLAADFASFYDACQKAEVSLKSFEAGSAKVESQLSRMVDNFSGRKVIQEATLMAEAIDRGGGVTKLTAAELQRAGNIAAEAAEKMRALGMRVPADIDHIRIAAAEANGSLKLLGDNDGMDRLGLSTERAAGKVGGIKGELQKFDGILSSMGINLSAPIRAIGELGDMAGKSVEEIGLLGTAGAAFGAGIGGWKVGRLIADFFDLDQKIANVTAKLLGYGDVAGQEAAAAADALNGRLSYQENLLRQAAQAAEENNAVLSEAANEWNFAASAVEEVVYEYTVYGDVVNGIIQSTGEAIDANEAYRSDLILTTEVIGEQADSLDVLAEKKRADAEASKAAAKAAAEAMRVFDQSFTTTLPTLSQAQIGSMGGETQARAKLQELEARAAQGPRGVFEGVVTQDQWRQAQEQQYLLEQLRAYFQGVPGFASGVENFGGGLARVHQDELLVNLPRGTDVIPAGRGMGGGSVTNHYSISMTGMVGDTAALGRHIEKILINLAQSKGRQIGALG